MLLIHNKFGGDYAPTLTRGTKGSRLLCEYIKLDVQIGDAGGQHLSWKIKYQSFQTDGSF